ncbi:hypothetical protein VTK73DRAFT_5185 [Phialemonium thermophilum]|uniref:Transaldolase n=1 Tax=Phialemonium thermophilum TaxID=223376 RepID=A0ABR3V314_9PEZI
MPHSDQVRVCQSNRSMARDRRTSGPLAPQGIQGLRSRGMTRKPRAESSRVPTDTRSTPCRPAPCRSSRPTPRHTPTRARSNPSWSSPGASRIPVLLPGPCATPRLGLHAPCMANIPSHFFPEELFAMAEMGCQHITVSAANLKKLVETPDTLPPVTRPKPAHPYAGFAVPERLRALLSTDPLAGPHWDGVKATLGQVDYVADNGARLDQFIQSDPVVSKRFADAEQLFLAAENEARQAIEKEIAAAGLH